MHIEGLSHSQLNSTPVGKLVTRVTNDTNAISMMFTNIIVNLVKNSFIIIGIFIAMLCLNYMFTLMVLCFVPFIVLFTMIFRKFSRKAYRRVKDRTTDINVYLSETLSGMKIIQSFNCEDRKKDEFNRKNEELGKAKKGEMFVFSIFRPIVYMLYVSSVLCLFYLAGKGYIKDFSFMGQIITVDIVVTFVLDRIALRISNQVVEGHMVLPHAIQGMLNLIIDILGTKRFSFDNPCSIIYHDRIKFRRTTT